MDGLFELLAQLVVHWRVGLASLVVTVASVVLAVAIPPFTGGHGIALVLLGFGAGLLWEVSSSKQKGN